VKIAPVTGAPIDGAAASRTATTAREKNNFIDQLLCSKFETGGRITAVLEPLTLVNRLTAVSAIPEGGGIALVRRLRFSMVLADTD
jgi:hypothetical protein